MIKLSTLCKLALPALILSAITLFSQSSYAQCSTAGFPSYSGNCTNQYFSSISATGAGVTSTLTVSGVSSCTGTYINDFTTQGIAAPLGGVLTLNLTRGGTLHAGYVTVFVDWDNDGTYATSENAGPLNPWVASSAAMSYPVSIPLSGVTLATHLHMRVMLSQLATGAPCTADTGQTYDFFFQANACAVTPAVTVTPRIDTFCIGTAALVHTATGAGSGGTYTWMPGTGLSATTGATVLMAPSVTTTYTVTGYASTGCPDTAITTVRVFSPPPAVVGAASVCAGSNVAFSDSLAGGTWVSGSTSLATVVATTGVVHGVSAGTVAIIYRMPSGCSSSASLLVNPITIPAVNFTATPGFTVCEGTTVTYHCTQTGGGSAPYFEWLINGVLMDTGVNYTYTPLNGDIVTCRLTSNAICPTPAVVTHSITMVVNPILTPHVTIGSSLGDTTCLGIPVTLTAIPVNGGSSPIYRWKINTLTVGTASNTYTYVPANGDVIEVRLTSNSTCQSTDSAFGYKQLRVLPFLTPTLHMSATPVDSVCEGDHVIYSLTGTNAGLSPQYFWTVNNVPAGMGTSHNYVPMAGDHVRAIMLSSYHCLSIDTARDSMTVLVRPAEQPLVVIHVSPGTIIPSGTNATFNAIVSNIPAASTVTYQWFINGFLQPGAVLSYFISHSFHSGDSVLVQVVDHGVCENYTVFGYIRVYVGANVGVGNVQTELDDISLFPNPNSGNFTLEYITSQSGELNVTICDVTGRIVNTQKWTVEEGKNNKTIDAGNMPKGIYFVKVASEAGTKVIKTIIE